MTQQQVLSRTTPQPETLSAGRLLSRGQLAFAGLLAVLAAAIAMARAAGYGPSPAWWGQAAVVAVTTVYVAATVFLFATVLRAGHSASAHLARAGQAADEDLPLYTILVRDPGLTGAGPGPLPESLAPLDYPRTQVLLIGPDAADRDAGLDRAEGEFCVVYDVADSPEPGQLRDAVQTFRELPAWVVCLQAQLAYGGTEDNWLAQCFAAEYAVSFGLFLRGLDKLGLVIPLSGTSHHFRTEALRRVGGWDPRNASEGTDLGVRVARRGWVVRTLPTLTRKRVSGRLADWTRQRTRWDRGYLQTWLVHMRSPGRLWRDLGVRRFLGLQLTFALNVAALVNPLLAVLAIACLVAGRGQPALLAAMLTGNLLMVYSLMIGCLDQGLFRAVRTMLLVPLYWALMSVAAYRALFPLRRVS